MHQLIAQARDELAGRGLYYRRKAKGDRSQQLEQQIEVWERLIQKIGGTD